MWYGLAADLIVALHVAYVAFVTVGLASIVVGGPPCQAFSQVRNHSREIDDPRNAGSREFVTLVREALPLSFLMENVTGIDQPGVREQIG